MADLGRVPLFALERPPVGYLHLSDDADLAERLAELCALTGIFDKPRYFRLDPEACAFTARGVPGCSRCLDVCPTDALKPVNGRIQIDPHLCQGFGSCASACPTGAIGYHQPDANTSGDYLFRLLKHYREAGGDAPQLLIASESERERVEAELTRLPANWLPVWVEESASLGIESWFAALAYGASAVRIALGDDAPASVRALVERELASAAVLLASAGLAADRIGLFNPDAEQDKPLSGEPALALLDKPLKGISGKTCLPPSMRSGKPTKGAASRWRCPTAPLMAAWSSKTLTAPSAWAAWRSAQAAPCMRWAMPRPQLYRAGLHPVRHVRKGVPRAGHRAGAPPATGARGAPRRAEPQSRRGGLLHSLRQAVLRQPPLSAASSKTGRSLPLQNEAAQRLLMCEECRVRMCLRRWRRIPSPSSRCEGL